MSSHKVRWLPWVLIVALLAACSDDPPPTPPPKAGADAPSAPALLRAPKQKGEILVSGEASPATRGPFEFDGRYRVRFAQYAPEDAHLDFTTQIAFVAELGPATPGPGAKPIRLFRDAARSGTRTLAIHGRHTVDVTFGDYPYVVRFTPAG